MEETQKEIVKAKYKIIDNALDDMSFATIKSAMMSAAFDWHFVKNIVDPRDESATGYFLHNFYHTYKPVSPYIKIIEPVLKILQPEAIIRIKGNLYTKNLTNNLNIHNFHKDFTYPHEAAIYYVNDNNGFTILEDGTKIESKANRLLLLQGWKDHASTDCTDVQCRVNIAFNFFNSKIIKTLDKG